MFFGKFGTTGCRWRVRGGCFPLRRLGFMVILLVLYRDSILTYHFHRARAWKQRIYDLYRGSEGKWYMMMSRNATVSLACKAV